MIRIFNFIVYLIRSIHLHGIHSPFVFQLVNEVIREKAKYYAYDEIESIRAKLLLTKKQIAVRDLGAKKRNSYQKSIATICKESSQSAQFAQIIHRLARHSEAETILELGTSLGITTSYLAKARPQATIISIEGSDELSKIADINLKKLSIFNVKLQVESFEDGLEKSLKELQKADLIYFDGHHTYEATLDYFQRSLPFAHEKSVFIFDDIYWSSGMKKAWQEIRQNEKVSCSIDLFKIGLIFFDPTLTPKHYTVYHPANFSLS